MRITIRKGLETDLPTLSAGEFGLCTDSPYKLFLGTGGGNQQIILAGSTTTYAFKTIDCPAGTDPVADSTTDTLVLTTSNSNYLTITGDSTNDNIAFAIVTGIANTNILRVDHASPADNDYAKFTANGIEGRSYAEVRTDLGLATGDSPVFVTVKLSGLTNGYVPYHVSDATGLANSGLWTDGTKVGIGTATVPHGGVGMAKLAVDGAAGSTAGPHVQFTTVTDDYPLMQFMNWEHDSIHILFDSYYDGSFRSSDVGSNFRIRKQVDLFKIEYDSGIAQGDAITWNDGIVLDTSGIVKMPAVYGHDMNGETIRDLQINDSGELGYSSSAPMGKINEGTIVAWTGGYYTNGSNGSYTRVLGSANTAAAVNTLLNASGWYVCNGAAINLGTSTIHDGANRYIENLTDDRFLMGDTAAGGIGGSSTMAHTHAVSSHYHILPLTHVKSSNLIYVSDHFNSTNMETSSHTRYTCSSHEDKATQSDNWLRSQAVTGSTGGATSTENRPKYLSVFYIKYLLA